MADTPCGTRRPLGLTRRGRGWRWRGRWHPDPLPRLRPAVAIENVLAVRVDHLTLDERLLIGHRWLLHHSRRGIDRIWRIGIVRVGVVRIGQRCSESETTDEKTWTSETASTAVMETTVEMSTTAATTSRGMFALARHELLPSPLARISARFRTPIGGIASVSVVALLVLVIVTLATSSVVTNVLTVFGIMSTIGSLLIELIYVALCVAGVRLVMEEPTKWWGWLILLVAFVTPVLGIYGSVVPFPAWPLSLGIYIVIAVVALSLIWTLVNRFVFPVRLGKASEPHPWEVEEIEPETAPASPTS